MSQLLKLLIAQRIGLFALVSIGCLGAMILAAMSGLIGDAMEAQGARRQAVSMAVTRSLTKQIGDAFSVRDGKPDGTLRIAARIARIEPSKQVA